MKTTKFLLFFILFFTLQKIYAQPTDYVGYWPFEGNANDASANGNNGSVNGATLTADRFGNPDNAYQFDGYDDYIIIPYANVLDFGTTSFSVSVWIRPDSNCDNARIINNRGTGLAGNYKGYQMKVFGNGSNWMIHSLAIDNATGDMKYCQRCAGDYPFTFDEWKHVTMVRDGDNVLEFFVDGASVGTVSLGGNYGDISNGLPTAIGAAIASEGSVDIPSTASQFFSGKIDDIFLYDYALSESEVFDLYAMQNPSNPEGALWSLSGNNIFYTAGNVTIGTPNVPSEYKFAVDGEAIFEGVKVKVSEDWPDYVFDESYEISELNEVENHIKNKKHLPGVPSKAEVLENGVELGEMNKILLQKIEELTLYIIDLKKENQSQSERIEQQQKQLEILMNQLEK